jgi:Xaa-Pro aminopeptidase
MSVSAATLPVRFDRIARVQEGMREHGLIAIVVMNHGHGIGLRFEEPPAPTIIPPHRSLPLTEGMTITIGHPVLAMPGFGGVRFEDVYRPTADGPRPLAEYPIDPVIPLH